ncbi:MAG: SAM-dependent methyltransferase [Flavobacteriaceae bacterium]
MTGSSGSREGEVALDAPPRADDAGLVFVGHVETPWRSRADCPRNIRQARERDGWSRLHVAAPFRPALTGLAVGQPIIVLYWLGGARRDLILQRPRHRDTATGTFNLRSPVRPNPIGLAVTTIRTLNVEQGVLDIDPLDCLDGTSLIDIKPWLESVDIPAAATPAG